MNSYKIQDQRLMLLTSYTPSFFKPTCVYFTQTSDIHLLQILCEKSYFIRVSGIKSIIVERKIQYK